MSRVLSFHWGAALARWNMGTLPRRVCYGCRWFFRWRHVCWPSYVLSPCTQSPISSERYVVSYVGSEPRRATGCQGSRWYSRQTPCLVRSALVPRRLAVANPKPAGKTKFVALVCGQCTTWQTAGRPGRYANIGHRDMSHGLALEECTCSLSEIDPFSNQHCIDCVLCTMKLLLLLSMVFNNPDNLGA